MSDISTVTSSSSVSPMCLPSLPQLLGQAAGQQPGQRLALLLAVDDRLVQHPQPAQRAVVAASTRPWPASRNSCSTSSATASGVVWRATAMALIGLPSAMKVSSSWSASLRSSSPACTGRTSASTIDRVEQGAAGGDGPDGVDELVALGQPVLQQVASSRRRPSASSDTAYSGSSYWDRITIARAGVALADLLGGVDALALERRRHADVGHHDLRLRARRRRR